jgi:hypothetical protein
MEGQIYLFLSFMLKAVILDEGWEGVKKKGLCRSGNYLPQEILPVSRPLTRRL